MSISVVIPVFNPGHRLGQALASVAAQTSAPLEVIVIDDGSGDGAVEQVRTSHPDFQFVRQAQRGPAAARNVGIARASGDWVAFLDADDLWREDHLAQVSAMLEGSDAVGMLSNRMDFFDDPAIAPVAACGYELDAGQHEFDLNQMLCQLERGFYFCQSSVVLRRSSLVDGYCVGMNWGEDIELFLRLLARGAVCKYNPARTVSYRVDTPGGLSRNYASTTLGQFRALKMIGPQLSAPSPVYERLLNVMSRRALLAALAYSPRQNAASIWAETRTSIAPLDKALVLPLLAMPAVAGALHRMRHQYLQSRGVRAGRQAGPPGM